MSTKVNRVKSTGPVEGSTVSGLTELCKAKDVDEYTYYDPIGWTTPGPKGQNTVTDVRSKMYDKGGWEDKFNQVNEYAQKGAGVELREAVRSSDTGSVSLPVWVDDSIFISDSENQPIVEGLARIAVQGNDVKLDEVTDVAQINSAFDEGDSIDVSEDTIAKYEYSIYGVGIKKAVSDKLIHTDRYSPEQLNTELAAESIQRYKESQAIQGSEHDATGFEGLADWVDTEREFDYGDDDTTLDADIVGDLVTELEVRDTNRGDMMVVTDVRSFKNLVRSMDEVQRFELPQEAEFTLSFGPTAIMVDGVMVTKSHGCPDEDGVRECYAFDASGTRWYHLSDTTVKPLGPSDTEELMFVYEYVTLGSNARERIARATGLGTAQA